MRALFFFLATTAVILVFHLTIVAGGFASHGAEAVLVMGTLGAGLDCLERKFSSSAFVAQVPAPRCWQRRISDSDHRV